MDLLDVRVTADDVLHAVQVLAALVHDEVGAVIGEGRRGFERHAGTGEEVLDGHFFRTLAVAGAGATGGRAAEGAGRAARSRGARAARAETGHLEHGRGGQRVDLGFEEVVAGVLGDFDDAAGADREAEAHALTGVVEGLVDRDAAQLDADVRVLVRGVDEDDVHALLVLVVGSGLRLEEGQRAVEGLVADDEAFRKLDGLHLLDDRVVAVGGVELDVFAVEDFGELPGLVEELEELALGHAAIPLAGVFGQHLADADLVGLGFGIIRLVLQHFAIGVEGALVVAVEVAGAALDEQLVDLVVLHADTRRKFVDVAVGRVGALRGEFLLQADDAGVILALEFGVLGDRRRGLDHVAGFDGDEGAAGEGGALDVLDALLEWAVGEAGGAEGAISGFQVGDGLVERFGRALTDQGFGGGDGIAALAEGGGVGLGETLHFVLGGGGTAGVALDDDFLLGEGDGVAELLGSGGGREGAVGSVEQVKGALEVAGGGLLAGDFDGLGYFGEQLLMGGGDFLDGADRLDGRSGGGRGLGLGGGSLGGRLGGGGLLDGGIDGGEAFRGSGILGVDREDGFELGLGGLQVAFVAGLDGLGEELRLARGGIAVLGDQGASGEGEGEGCPGKLRTVEVFHVLGL